MAAPCPDNNPSEVLIALGSNLGDRAALIREATRLIGERCGTVVARSTLIETAPVGGQADQPFLNGAVICSTRLAPEGLLAELMAIERDLGRERSVHWGNRTADCDVILWRNEQGEPLSWRSATLVIPHPRMLERAFVLEPANEIAGSWRHPVTGRTIAEELTTLMATKKGG